MNHPVIAIDGPAASGKGTVARMLAEHFCFAYLDSGILYRAVACLGLVLSTKMKTDAEISSRLYLSDICSNFGGFLHAISDAMSEISNQKGEELKFLSPVAKILSKVILKAHELVSIADNIPENVLRSELVGVAASIIGQEPEIRNLLTRLMREFAIDNGRLGSVIDGRDIGTIVFPDAICKIFLTANLKVRAERRFKEEQRLKNKKATFDSIYEALKNRDARDSSRKLAPMTCSENHIVVDTSEISAEEAFNKLVGFISVRLRNS